MGVSKSPKTGRAMKRVDRKALSVGRPLIFTAAIAERICADVARGCPLKLSAAACGISSSTIHKWLSDEHPQFDDFRASYAKAQAEARIPVVRHLMAIARGEVPCDAGAKVAMFLVARWFPEEYGDKAATPQPQQTVNVAIIAARERAHAIRNDDAALDAYYERLGQFGERDDIDSGVRACR